MYTRILTTILYYYIIIFDIIATPMQSYPRFILSKVIIIYYTVMTSHNYFFIEILMYLLVLHNIVNNLRLHLFIKYRSNNNFLNNIFQFSNRNKISIFSKKKKMFHLSRFFCY